MKNFIFLLVICVQCLASPRINPYVNHEDPAQDRLSDLDMHPHKPTRKYSKKIDGYSFNEKELTSEYWLENAKAAVEEQLKVTTNTNKAKNVIMFLGDGMSHYSIAAARLLMGGEEAKLVFEKFPFTANSMTYCVDVQVSDSACTATAYLSGIKTNDAEIGLNAKTAYKSCEDYADKSNHVDSIATWFQNANKSSGIVTTTRITHATPSGIYAHTTNRDWEDDSEVVNDGCDSEVNDDIAEQLVYGETAKKLKVIFGGGARHFVGTDMTEHGQPGRRNDTKNLINEWKAMDSRRQFIRDRKQLMDVKPEEVHQIMGLFNHDHINYWIDIERDNKNETMPSLKDMTLKAIDILETDKEGYFLLVEGGRIDQGHHATEARHAITEAVEFSKAIEAALEKVNLNETLIVVTADHGHIMTIAGYADRGNDIFGIAGEGDDDIPYMTLSYGNGKSYYNHVKEGKRVDPLTLDRYSNKANDFEFPSTVPRDFETHGGEDVGVWAIGPWAHLFQGTLEQNVIAHIMAYASCVGDGLKACDKQ